jgi:copper chaperone
VPGISCEHCKTVIEDDVGALDGVESVEVDVEAQTVDVDGEVDPAAVEAAITAAGYPEVTLA